MDRTLQRALRLHEDGELTQAEAAYQRHLSVHPEDAGALRLLGLLRIQQDDYTAGEALLRRAVAADPADGEAFATLGDALQLQRRIGEAIACYQQALSLGDGRGSVWCNLGLALQHRGDSASALRCYTSALKADPEHLLALYNRGLLRYEQGDIDGAIESYEAALRVDPLEVDLLNNLGNALFRAGRLDEALATYQRGLAVEADHHLLMANFRLAAEAGGDMAAAAAVLARQEQDAQLWVGTGLARQRRGDTDGAAEAFRRALAVEPGEPTARHMLDTLIGEPITRAAPDYIAALFDDYAPRFEGHLVSQLGYQIPALMRWLLGEVCGAEARFSALLDLGCGTGLVGAELREIVDRMVGVDLSAEMLRRSRNRGIYDDLHRAELVGWLAQADETFDLVVAADVLIYTGDLGPFFAALAAVLRPGGRLLFSTERLEDDDGQHDYVLLPTGRFAHSRAYLRRLAAAHGLTEERIGRAEIRRTRVGWEEGDVVLLQKTTD